MKTKQETICFLHYNYQYKGTGAQIKIALDFLKDLPAGVNTGVAWYK